MLDIVALVVGVPLVLITLMLALAWFEASMTPEHLDSGERPEPVEPRAVRGLEIVDKSARHADTGASRAA